MHTTVVGPQGKPIEVQIRTNEMHNRAEFGVASHFLYKEQTVPRGSASAGELDLPWLARIIDWEKETSDPDEFMASLKIDLDQEEVFVFTPKGDVFTLVTGSTPIDFAYAIHTDVGLFTSKSEGAAPSQDWLLFVRTPRAASKIKQWFSRERREDAIAQGQEDIQKALRRDGLPVQKILGSKILDTVADKLNYTDLTALYAAVGEHHLSGQSVSAKVSRELESASGSRTEESLPATVNPPRRRSKQAIGVHVEGLDDVLVRLSRCCTPVPGDEIVGFVTRGRGVSVHRSDCANALSLVTSQNDRVIDVEWDSERETGYFVASIEVKAYDRSRLLSDVTSHFSDNHINILSASTLTGSDRIARLRFDFEIADPSHLENLLRSVRKIDTVYDAYRIMPGKGG